MCLCCAVVGVFLGLAFFSATYYSIASAAHKHVRASINEASVGFGGFLGSLACGMLAERYGVVTPFLYAPVLLAVGIAAQWMLLEFGKLRQPTHSSR